MSLWKSWDEINQISNESTKIYLYGRSEDWVHKAIKSLDRKPDGIVDREERYHNTKYLNLPIFPISSVTISSSIFFIITAGDFEGIVDTLESYGLVAGKNFACSPIFMTTGMF